MPIDWEKCNSFVIDANIPRHLLSGSEENKDISNKDGHITCLLSAIITRKGLEYLVDSDGHIFNEYKRIIFELEAFLLERSRVNGIGKSLFRTFIKQTKYEGFLRKVEVDCEDCLMQRIREAGVPLCLEKEKNQDPDALLVYVALKEKKPLITNDYADIIRNRDPLDPITYPDKMIFSSREAAGKIKGNKNSANP